MQVGCRVAGMGSEAAQLEPPARRRRSSSNANRTLAIFDCPYTPATVAALATGDRRNRIRPKRWAVLLTVTTRASRAPLKQTDQLAGQGEMAEMVGAKLQLKALSGLPSGRCHHAGIVDQEVEASALRARGRSAKLRTDSRRERSSSETLDSTPREIQPGSLRRRASPLSVSRQARVTSAPAASQGGEPTTLPKPLLAPVTTAALPPLVRDVDRGPTLAQRLSSLRRPELSGARDKVTWSDRLPRRPLRLHLATPGTLCPVDLHRSAEPRLRRAGSLPLHRLLPPALDDPGLRRDVGAFI